jgi:hypothetical protein
MFISLIRILGVTLVLQTGYMLAGIITNIPVESTSDSDPSLLLFLLYCLLLAIALSVVIQNSQWAGAKLVIALIFSFFGFLTFMSLIEASYFMTNIPSEYLPQLWLMGAIVVTFTVPLAVMIHGKAYLKESKTVARFTGNFTIREWIWKTGLIAFIYLIIYFTFGYYIAWQSAELREFYGSTEFLAFFPHIKSVIFETTLIPFQVVRSVFWMLFAIPLVWMLNGGIAKVSIITGFAISILHSAQLMLPNPYMPETIRYIHLIETSTSMFLFGTILGIMLYKSHNSVRDLFRIYPSLIKPTPL